MKFLPLIWRNALRNRLRTGLTVAGITFLLLVVILVATALTELRSWEGAKDRRRLAVQHSTGLATWLPIELEDYLKGEALSRHAQHVQKLNWFGGFYQDPKNQFANFAVDHDQFRELWEELILTPEAYGRFVSQKNAVLVGRSLMKKFGWKEGQRITLIGTIYSCNPELEIVGVYTCDDIRQEEQMHFRWDYFDELLGRPKYVGTYWLRARSAEDVPRLKDLIDGHTRNSSDPTETMTEKEFGQQFAQMMGNVKLIVILVCVGVLAMMVLMTANTMAMSTRERVVEIAVLRTLGFTRRRIVWIIVGESLLMGGMATVIAAGLSLFVFNVLHLSPFPAFFPYFLVQPATLAVAAAIALFCGSIGGVIVPAWLAARRKIADGLRQVV